MSERSESNFVTTLDYLPDPRLFSYVFEARGRPLLIRGGVSSWAAVGGWSIDSLANLVGQQEFELEYSASRLFDPNISDSTNKVITRTVKYQDALVHLCNPGAGAYYIREADISSCHRLLRDIGSISLIPERSRTFSPGLWIGSIGASSPIHFDGGDYNFLAHISGEKVFRLFPPRDTPKLYPNLFAKLPHLSKVNHLNPDLIKYPRYADAVYSELVLKPGDLLFVPRNWWHCTISMSLTISLNFFWQRSWLSRRSLTVARLGARLRLKESLVGD
ncbi:cupin-like domain-containing protein [Pseudomonas putida]|uniref:cupin-like domain-containing protein n=1 Tax=Pseudomonas putida TaxID=303 RepID=UPI003CC7DBEB